MDNSLPSWASRREFLIGAGVAGAAVGAGLARAYSQAANAPDQTLRIVPLRLELAPGKSIDTFAYNGTVPGPLLRLRDGQHVNIDITNETDIDDIVHWHGLYVPSVADGAMEEGSPMVERGASRRYSFPAKPSGTRWYHSHDVAGTDLRRSLYSGMYGFLIIEPASNPGRMIRKSCSQRIIGNRAGSVCRISARGRPPTTVSKCCTHRPPSTTRC
jgi:FtsP/CotA-like multicopper oxidase with cupredoxin domain